MNLAITPFSYFGSYMSIALLDNALWIRSLHGKSKSHMNSIRLIPVSSGTPVPYVIESDYTSITLKTSAGTIRICFSSDRKLVFSGDSGSLGLRFDTIPKYNFEYSYFLNEPPVPYCIINSYKNLTKYLLYCTEGRLSLNQQLKVDTTGSTKEADNHSQIDIYPENEGFTGILQDIPTNMLLPDNKAVTFNDARSQSKKEFDTFCATLPPVEQGYQEAKKAAAYVLWSSTVKPEGYLRHYSIYSSNKDFPGVWSWDNCFMALSLASSHPELAWAQMEVIYDYQDEYGQVPGSVSDSTLRWNFSKPPIQGYFFHKMMEKNDFSKEQLTKIYKWISKQVDFYFTYKDSNHDGICEYHHGNDCGQDNSTVFANPIVIDSPDLTAFLIKAFDLLEIISVKLGFTAEAEIWKEKADSLTALFHKYFIVDQLPYARETSTGTVIQSGSLLPYMSLILGSRLDHNVKAAMVSHLKKHHLTSFGVATESLDSPLYEDDAYWRGPIWGPSTLLIVEALIDCEEPELAYDISRRYCDMVSQYGFAENFDAKTGIGLRDKSFCWTAAAFLHLASKLKERNI